jgi:hypothetical protein
MMTAIVFNGTKIYMDTDMELHVIRGDLHIDTKAFKAEPKARSGVKVKRGASKRTSVPVTATLRDAKLKVGKSLEIVGKRGTIAWAVRHLDMSAKVVPGRKEGSWLVTRTA